MKKRWQLLCTLLLLFSLLVSTVSVHSAWDDGLMFMALNDSLVELSADTMPITVNGVVYIPYTLLDSKKNGGHFVGVYCDTVKNYKNTLVFYDRDGSNLIFDLTTGLSYNTFPDGDVQSPRSLTRNGQIYISINTFSTYFGHTIHYFYSTSKYGYPLIRVYGSDVNLHDQVFVTQVSASSLFTVLNNYYASLNLPFAPDEVLPDPPTAEEFNESATHLLTTHLAFRFDLTDHVDQVLDTLKQYEKTATLFFHPHHLATHHESIRRAIGEGHLIGFISDGDDDKLLDGNQLLRHIALWDTRMILQDQASTSTPSSSWLTWNTTLDARTMSSSAMTSTLSNRTTTQWILLDDSTTGLYNLTRLLIHINGGEYAYKMALESSY